MSEQWHYNRNGAPAGPIGTPELQRLAAAGEITRADLVWKAGMPEWAPAGSIEELFPAIPIAAADPAPLRSPEIGYFSNSSGLPERLRKTLKGFASATGDRGDWPLSDQHMDELKAVNKLRKRIRNCANMYKSLFALTLIALVVVSIALISTTVSSGGRGMNLFALGGSFGLLTAFTLLYFFTWRATMKCHKWAPLTMFVIFLISIAANVVAMVWASFNARNPVEEAIGPFISIIFLTAFAVTSWRAFAAIPRFLTSPLWAQETIVHIAQ